MSISPSGANKFLVRGFKNRQKMKNHWKDHSLQYLGFTEEQYENRAISLIESPVDDNILGHIDKSGVIVRYDKNTNDFVKGHPLKGIFTMFKPEAGIEYYFGQKEEDIKNGGSE